MSDKIFVSEVVQEEARQVVGLKIKTTMETAGADCSQLWNVFGPRMAEIATGVDAFGASVMIDAQSFDYWAALPYSKGQAVPVGMDVLDISGGFYAKVGLDDISELAPAYMYMFQVWSESPEYSLRCDVPSYELYPPDHLATGKLILYMPLKKNK